MPGRRAFLASMAVALLPSARAVAQVSSASDRPLVLATSTPGGGFARYGETLERVLNAAGQRPLIAARMTRGTVENLELLHRGDVDAALIQGTAADPLFAAGPASGLRVLFAMYPSPGMLAVPASSTVRRLEDVVGQPVVFGVRTSGLVTLGRQVYAGIGLDIDRDLRAIYVDEAAEAPGLVLSGRALGLWGAGEGWPGFTRLAEAPGGARFVGPTPAQIAAIGARYPLLKSMEVAVGAYPGIDAPLPTVGSVNFIVVHADLDDARATRFVEAMQAAVLPHAAFGTLANTRASVPSPAVLHRVVAAGS